MPLWSISTISYFCKVLCSSVLNILHYYLRTECLGPNQFIDIMDISFLPYSSLYNDCLSEYWSYLDQFEKR